MQQQTTTIINIHLPVIIKTKNVTNLWPKMQFTDQINNKNESRVTVVKISHTTKYNRSENC